MMLLVETTLCGHFCGHGIDSKRYPTNFVAKGDDDETTPLRVGMEGSMSLEAAKPPVLCPQLLGWVLPSCLLNLSRPNVSVLNFIVLAGGLDTTIQRKIESCSFSIACVSPQVARWRLHQVISCIGNVVTHGLPTMVTRMFYTM